MRLFAGLGILFLACGAEGILKTLLRSPGMKLPFGFCPGMPLPAASPSAVLSKLGPFLDEVAGNISAILEEHKSPGGVVVNVVYNDTVIWTKGFGLINDSDPSRGAPDGDSAFRIGSISKVFTALMMLMYRDARLLPSLDEDVTHYLPELKIQNPFQTKRGITFQQLSSHMAGLPRETPCSNIFFDGCNLTYNEIYENLAKMNLMYPPGLLPDYSNLGFGILGRTLEKIKGPTWEVQLEETILKPLQMKNSGTAFTPESLKHLAVGYFPDGTVAKLIDIGYEAPAGQMYASTNDLAELMKMLFQPERAYNPQEGQILDGETIREWMEPAYTFFDGTGYGHPWELVPLGNYTLRTKSGEMPGYNAEFYMAHEIKTGFVLLQSCDMCSSHAKIIEVSQQIIMEVSRLLWTMQPGPQVPPTPRDYVGVYTGAEVYPTLKLIVNLTLGEVNGHQALLVEMVTGPASLGGLMIMNWVEGDAFQLSTQGLTVPCPIIGAGWVGERVYFQRSGSEVTSLSVPGLFYGMVFKRISKGF